MNYYFTKHDKGYGSILAKVDGLNSNIEYIMKRDLMIMQDQKVPRKTYILNRGAYDQPMKNKEIHMNTPDILPPMTQDMPKNRLGLAKWIMSDENPLTARVTVNRYWSMLFGKGLVSTPGDFGSQGSWPTNPELLDYMASDFKESDWNVKRMIKKIMMSATYRQDSVISKEKFVKRIRTTFIFQEDRRYRLQGDFIRDNALHVSGLLNPEIGGASTKPYQPPGLVEGSEFE